MFTAEITRANPGCFIFLIDQSASMQDPIGDHRKSDMVSDAINRLLQEIAIGCATEAGVRDYFYLSVIGYGNSVQSAFTGSMAGRDTVPISEVANCPSRLEDGIKKIPNAAGGLVEQRIKFPVWMDPVAEGAAPMGQALETGREIARRWIDQHPSSFPPVVLNLTAGEASDGNPEGAAARLRSLSSIDGNVLLFNLHISSDRSPPITFPDTEAALADRYAKQLFRMSSVVPTRMNLYAQQQGFRVSEATRGFVFNADATSTVQFLDIGTRTARHLWR